jgi:hypothetical protein
MCSTELVEHGWLSRYSDWLRILRQRDQGLSPFGVKNFHFSLRPNRGRGAHPTQYQVGTLVSPTGERGRGV